MANGNRYDRNAMTCAHKKLPFGTMLRVTNLNNGNSVVVEVTDRGPYVAGRIVDLSYRAASELGMLGAGVVRVKVEILPQGATIPYRTDEDNPLELPEGYEAGLAGVCYEFIPEWEKTSDTEIKTVPRKTQPQTDKKKHSSTSTAITKQQPKQQKAQSQSQQRSQQPQQQKKAPKQQPRKQEESSKSWTQFFRDLF